MARSLARSLAPAEKPETAPSWLLPGPGETLPPSAGRARALRRRAPGRSGGERQDVRRSRRRGRDGRARPTACLVPAALADQWRGVAARLGRAGGSRHPRAGEPRPAADHRPRDRAHRREPSLSEPEDPALLARRALAGGPAACCCSARRPIVNRLDDLAHQLLLGVRDDALVAEGVLSIRTARRRRASGWPRWADSSSKTRPRSGPSRALDFPRPRHERGTGIGGPRARARTRPARALRPPADGRPRPRRSLRALASSPAAMAGALRRYRQLLLHARDARRAGRALTRGELRLFTGAGATRSCCGSYLRTAAGWVTSLSTIWTAWSTSSHT